MVSSPLHCDSSSMQSFRPTLVNEGAMGRHSIDLDAFSIKRVLHSHLSKKLKECPGWGSNSRPSDCSCLCDYETDALPTALPRHMAAGAKVSWWSYAVETYQIDGKAAKACIGLHQNVYDSALPFDLLLFNETFLSFVANFAPPCRSLRGLMDKASAS
jgi:hypothetical protein